MKKDKEFHAVRVGNRVHLSECRTDGKPGEIIGADLVPDGANLDAYNGPAYELQGTDSGHVRMVEIHSGPAKVATKAYRDGWDRCFGGGMVN